MYVQDLAGLKGLPQGASTLLETTMFDWKSVAFMVPVIAIPIATAVVVIPPTVKQLHIQTVQQCQDRAWPQHQAPQHEEFCRFYMTGQY